MRSLRPNSRRTPDWQIGCIDSKWKWIVPWGVFGVVGAAMALLGCTPWICEFIERNTFYEFRLSFADPSTAAMSETMVVRIHSEHEIQVGETVLDVSPPKIRTDEDWLLSRMEWKQECIRKNNLRTAVRRELKRLPATPTVVVRVNSRTSLETIAIVWTSIQAISKASLYLEVTDVE